MIDHPLVEQVAEQLLARDARLMTCESCTGGQIAAALTKKAGSSQWFEMGLVTYSNLSKQQLLGVNAATLQSVGAVSEQTVREMVQGALARYDVDYALSVSGIAGPGGGTAEKPVGTVFFAWAARDKACVAAHQLFSGDRHAIQSAAVDYALQGLLDYIH